MSLKKVFTKLRNLGHHISSNLFDPHNPQIASPTNERDMVLADSTTHPHQQSQSPFFTTLPPEIRNEIYSWALLQSEDASQSYREDSFSFRPGFRAPLKSRSDLLRTCRLVYLEADAFLMREAEHAFWFNRGPEERCGTDKCKEFFDSLTPTNLHDLVAVRFFTQMFWLEGGQNLNQVCHNPGNVRGDGHIVND